MGNYLQSRGDDQERPNLRDAATDGEAVVYKCRIEGVSKLAQEGFLSQRFLAKGYGWTLHMSTSNGESVGLRLCLGTRPSYPNIKAEFNMFIYNHKEDKHIEKRGTFSFMASKRSTPCYYMIPLGTFRDASSGFLVNDSCIYGVEIIRVHTSNMLECLSLFEGATDPVFYTWKIESDPKSPYPQGSSEAFVAGDLKWYILIHPNAGKENGHLSMFLKMDKWSAIQVESEVYVEFSLCVKNQKDGKDKKLTMQEAFSCGASKWGWSQFMSFEELYNPSKGFVVNNNFTIEASIAVIGSVSYCI